MQFCAYPGSAVMLYLLYSLVGFFPKGATPLYKATFACHVLCCISVSNGHIPRGRDRDLVDSIKHQYSVL